MAAKLEEETKKLILDTAYKLFAEFGYEQTPISLIMEKAGKSKATFYSHYETHKAVFSF